MLSFSWKNNALQLLKLIKISFSDGLNIDKKANVLNDIYIACDI